ncbi:MAG: glutamine synthetase family protein [Thermoplasmatota archaeon]
MPTKEEVKDICSEENIELVRILYVGNDGIPRGYAVNADDIDSVMKRGIALAKAMQSFTSLDHLVHGGKYGCAGEYRAVPDPDTFKVLPYAENSAIMIGDMYNVDGGLWDADPRSRLAKFLDELKDDGIEPSTAFEPEFYLVKENDDGTFDPFDDSLCFSIDGMQNTHDLVMDIKNSLEGQGMKLAAYYPEYGPGQQEMIIDHTRGISAADNYILYKLTVKGVAVNNGIKATFFPTPIEGAAASGCHMHISLWDGDTNLFYDENSDTAYPLSEKAKHFIGGLLEHAPALVALTAPTVTSYKRLLPHMWASAFTCWGEDNREAIVRVPSSFWDNRENSTRIEFKPADNTLNPYLALLGVLAAGKDGIDRELDPGECLNSDPADLSKKELEERGIKRLPKTLGEALNELKDDEVLKDALGPALHESYIEVKESQYEEYIQNVSKWEYEKFTRGF